MSQQCDRDGNFRGRFTEYGVKEQDSGAVAVQVVCALDEYWQDGEWFPWAEYDMEAYGDLYVVKKDGSLNHNQVEALVKHAGWDGNFESLAKGTWQPLACQVVVNSDEYKGNVRHRVSFVNGYDAVPGGRVNPLDPAKAKALQAKFGGELRALAGNSQRSAAPKPGGKPPAPNRNFGKLNEPPEGESPAPKRSLPDKMPDEESAAVAAAQDDDCPF